MGQFFVALLTLLTQFAATYLPGWIVDLLTGKMPVRRLTRVLPVVALIGISELVIEVLNRKKGARGTRAVSQKTAPISTAFRLGQDTG